MQGESIVIIHDGKPVARMVPPLGTPAKPGAREAAEAMLATRDAGGPTLGGITIRELIEEGRRA